MWDLAIDGETGDLIFSPHLDLLGAAGPNLTQQRILTRCKIPRGTFTYDVDGTLGSRLHTISSSATSRQVREAPALVEEALEPMTDIRVNDVDVSVDENNRLVVSVKYSNVVGSDETEDAVVDTTPDYDARVTI